jgi:hypothetical protein
MKRCAKIVVGNDSKRYKNSREATDDASANTGRSPPLPLGSTGRGSTVDLHDAALDLSSGCLITPVFSLSLVLVKFSSECSLCRKTFTHP